MLNCHIILQSSDLTPCDFWLLPTLKKHLCGRRFASNNEAVNEVHTFFNCLPQAKFEKAIKVKLVKERYSVLQMRVGILRKCELRKRILNRMTAMIKIVSHIFICEGCHYCSYQNRYILLIHDHTKASVCSFDSS